MNVRSEPRTDRTRNPLDPTAATPHKGLARWIATVVSACTAAASIYGMFAQPRFAVLGYLGILFAVILLLVVARAAREVQREGGKFYGVIAKGTVGFVVLYFMVLSALLLPALISSLKDTERDRKDEDVRFEAKLKDAQLFTGRYQELLESTTGALAVGRDAESAALEIEQYESPSEAGRLPLANLYRYSIASGTYNVAARAFALVALGLNDGGILGRSAAIEAVATNTVSTGRSSDLAVAGFKQLPLEVKTQREARLLVNLARLNKASSAAALSAARGSDASFPRAEKLRLLDLAFDQIRSLRDSKDSADFWREKSPDLSLFVPWVLRMKGEVVDSRGGRTLALQDWQGKPAGDASPSIDHPPAQPLLKPRVVKLRIQSQASSFDFVVPGSDKNSKLVIGEFLPQIGGQGHSSTGVPARISTSADGRRVQFRFPDGYKEPQVEFSIFLELTSAVGYLAFEAVPNGEVRVLQIDGEAPVEPQEFTSATKLRWEVHYPSP